MTPSEYRAAKIAKAARREQGRRACERGEHPRPLTWLYWRKRPIVPANRATEMLIASGMVGGNNCFTIEGKWQPPLGRYNGFCPRCGTAVEWSSDRPHGNERTPEPEKAE